MNENIDLCKILKDCPKGTKLYTPLAGEVEFYSIEDNDEYPIRVEFYNGNIITTLSFTEDGRYHHYSNGECLLFPSKDQRDWNKWQCPKPKKPKFDTKTLKPFDKVLVRDSYYDSWKCMLFSHIIKNERFPYICTGHSFAYCIPYNEETKHLVGTKEEEPEYYKY